MTPRSDLVIPGILVAAGFALTDFSRPLNILLFVGAAGLVALWISAVSKRRGIGPGPGGRPRK